MEYYSHCNFSQVVDTPLLLSSTLNEGSGLYAGDGSVDSKGKPALKNDTGQWKACSFILGTFFCERLAFYGISTNLVNYFIEKLHERTVVASTNITNWKGTCYITPLIGAILADTYWGRYWTIAGFTTVYLIGMCTLTLSASVSALKPAECVGSVCPSATTAQYAVFLTGLYLIALGTGGIKPCIWPFGADQFDDTDPKERVKKGSYFNWFYFSQNIGAIIASSVLVWIQDNVGWGIGFGIPTALMGVCIASLLIGTPLYRFQKPGGSPLTRICQVLVASFRKRNLKVLEDNSLLHETQDRSSAIEGSRKLEHSNELRCLDKAALISDADIEHGDLCNPWRLCTVTQVEELKILIRMFPIWATGIVFSAVFAQMSTLFVVQGKLMKRTLGSVTIPAASLSFFDFVSVIIWVPIYDSIIIPIVKKFTSKERGFSQLQRMGIGLFVSILCMAAAALVEIKRLQLVTELGLEDEKVAVPLSILWQIPQYFLLGAAEVFTFIGQHEFYYEQAPDAMRSLCSALSLLTNSLGNYLSSLILTIVTYVTTKGGKAGWIPDNLNEGHLDYFYWLLAGLSFLNLVVYMVFSRNYKEKKAAAA
ncbi:PREDICTED: protein NRT1/ PTR FAMILY 8.3-like isoform X3 [Prunus mume]|uniref:Protein NRT1/ PTR FAMILY 8.3-like isoform X3 n=1 Tax=Prunus mume TaxID=102107 RepID=A0ABM1LJV7_PRUMU|nr:PREDICTED: protein NRT1/ PTR FAMILY 8.3-like isoform X3 [Prunus mume]